MWVIVGPTACGKSQLAMQLAERSQGELLCFDSTTVYRDLNIGTGKPTVEDQQRCPHHLLDLVESGQEFSLAQFLEHAERALQEVRLRGRQPILVGGTYLYVRAFLQGFQVPQVPPDMEFRVWAEGQSLQALVEQLQALDPQSLDLVDLQNPRRVVRALEVCRTGRQFSEGYRRQPRADGCRKLGLRAEPDWLKARILKRCREMLTQGLRQEVQAFCEKGLREWLLSMRFIGYPEVVESLHQSATDENLAQSMADSTWKLVKKQRTWGRSEGGVDWLQADDPALVDSAWTKLHQPEEII